MFNLFPRTGLAIKRINDSGLAVVIVTNQSGVGRAFFDRVLVDQVHERLRTEIRGVGAHIDAIYYCPHHPDDACTCRKPRPGLLQQASEDMGLDLRQSFMIGDRYTDVRAGADVGARTILVLTGKGSQERTQHQNVEVQPDHIATTLDDAVEVVLGLRK